MWFLLTYELEVTEEFSKEYTKITKKDKSLLSSFEKKIEFLLENPFNSKPMQHSFYGNRRVHLSRCFVLIFEINESNKTILLKRIAHHDDAYIRKLD